jgi:DNA-binding PucR family transcriptional regulator
VSAVAAAQSTAERDEVLKSREAAMARREQALAEQQRVLAEQLRLLGGDTREFRRHTTSTWPPLAAYPRPANPVIRNTLTAFTTEPTGARGWWARVRRLLGGPEPAFDEQP